MTPQRAFLFRPLASIFPTAQDLNFHVFPSEKPKFFTVFFDYQLLCQSVKDEGI
jgi:hypothetical protein